MEKSSEDIKPNSIEKRLKTKTIKFEKKQLDWLKIRNGDKLKKSFNEIQSEQEELNEYGYPKNEESDKKERLGMDFGTWVGLILICIVMILGILKLLGIIWIS